MMEVLPITLEGDNLGRRHHYLNALVNETYQKNAPLGPLLEKPDINPIDRIFKINLASKHGDIDFIIRNLKEKDMLYVSQALKSKWLLEKEYSNIINPTYLERDLYPRMIIPAVNKMKNFIELNLKDPARCQEFYEYYKSDFDVAIKFLWHCSKEFIEERVLKVIDKLSAKHLRILCETCPQVAKVYFDGLQNNETALRHYCNNRKSYHNSIMNVLKLDAEIFFYIIEKYFDKSSLGPLGPSATRYVMKNHKNRYLAKPELYAKWILNKKTLALFLSTEEIEDIVTRLARAKYFSHSFTYKDAEPFIKRLSGEERAAIRKKIFVDKSFGEEVKEWPYPPPEGLDLRVTDCEPLKDQQHHPYEYINFDYRCCKKIKIMKKCARYMGRSEIMYSTECHKSSLVTLFDRYRFVAFDRVFFEFRKLLLAESTMEGRRNMLLVLVSKAGGNEAKVKQLLEFLVERHSNEPGNIRDAVARSIVKRTFGWRLSNDTWELLLKWATTSISEILHTKILRNLLAGSSCSPDDFAAYLLDFSNLTQYQLNAAEKSIVAKRLPELLVSAKDPSILLDVVETYKVSVESVPGAIDMLVTAARDDENVLRRLFNLRVARKHLFKESFNIIQTDAAYVNALRHDVSVLKNGESFVALLSRDKPNHDRFLRALVLYFAETKGLAARHLHALQKAAQEDSRESFARPLAFLFNVDNESLLDYISKNDTKTEDVAQKKFATTLRANAIVARPLIDVDVANWHLIGAGLVSNKVIVCSDDDVRKYIQNCLQWKKTMRIALQLAKRNNSVSETLATVIKARPVIALNLFLTDLRRGVVDMNVWNQVKPILRNLDFKKKPLIHIESSLENVDVKIVKSIEADYWTCVFEAFRRLSETRALPMLCNIENLLTQVEENSQKEIVTDFLNNKFRKDLIFKDFPDQRIRLYFRIIAKYLLMSKRVEEQNTKIDNTLNPFFDKLADLWTELESKEKSEVTEHLYDFVKALKYTHAFLDTKYVTCIPVFEKILERLPKFLPREKHFRSYAYIHITMLYHRSITQALKQKPEVFESQKFNDEGTKVIGLILGKYIGIEIRDLVQNYFRSIIEIYQDALLKFVKTFEYNESRERFVTAIVRGLIEVQGDSLILAQFMFKKNTCKNNEEILNLLKNADSDEMKFFLCEQINLLEFES